MERKQNPAGISFCVLRTRVLGEADPYSKFVYIAFLMLHQETDYLVAIQQWRNVSSVHVKVLLLKTTD